MKDYYKILDVEENATIEDIKKSYRKLAKKYHPDVNKEKNAEIKFKDITEAYDVLKDENKRKRYDFEKRGSPFSQNIFSDNFSNIFESSFFKTYFSGQNTSQEKTEKLNISIRLQLTLEEMFNGSSKKIKYKRKVRCQKCEGQGSASVEKKTCVFCGGTGKISKNHGMIVIHTNCSSCNGAGWQYLYPCPKCNGECLTEEVSEIDIVIPPGGFIKRTDSSFAGKGHESLKKKNKFGTLLVTLLISDHKYFSFTTNGDIVCEMTIPMKIAVCGGEIKVPTLHGEQNVYLEGGLNKGDHKVLEGKGFWKGNRKDFANHILVFDIEMPKNLNKEDLDKINSTSNNEENYPRYYNQFE